jgi:hypothetical protein
LSSAVAVAMLSIRASVLTWSSMLLLWMSSGEFRIVYGDDLVELAGNVAFEAADDPFLRQASPTLPTITPSR